MTETKYAPVTENVVTALERIVGARNVIFADSERMQDYSHDEVPGIDYTHMPDVVVKPATTLTTGSVRLYIGNQAVIENPLPHTNIEDSGSIYLEGATDVELRLEFAVSQPGALMRLFWTQPGGPKTSVPSGVLAPLNLPRNQVPTLQPVSPQTILAGQTLWITNWASDPDLPSQILTFSLDDPPAGASIDAAMRAIGQHVPYDSLIVVFGCCGDKDVSGMLEKISNGADKVIFTRVDNIRSADPEELASRYTELYGKMAQVAPTLKEALAIANRAVTKEDLICITGSFYLVGEAKRMFQGEAKE